MAAVILDEDAGLGDAEHDFTVEAFVAQRTVEALDVPILPGTAGFYIERLDLALSQPAGGCER